MSILQRSIVAPIFFWLLLIGALSFVLGKGLEYFIPTIDKDLILFISLATAMWLSFSLIVFKIHNPLNKIIGEMKALLTGKSYRRIMTSKRNEIGILAHFFNEVTRNLENISSDVKSHARIKKELNAAQKIQQDLLPKEAPEIPGLEVTAKTRPASEIGGDTFDFYVQEKRTLMYIGDSTGHGIPAGIVMVMVDTLIETFIDINDKLTDIIINLNKYIKPHLQTTMFMTMLLIEWSPETKTLKWIGAGHEYLIHVQTEQGQVTAIPSGGIAIGMIPDNSAQVKEQSFMLNENDFVVLYSDGINEAKNVRGEIYGLERFQNFIKAHAGKETSAEELFEKIAIDVGRFMEGHMQEDDMTLIVMKASTKKKLAQDSSTSWASNGENVAEPKASANVAPA